MFYFNNARRPVFKGTFNASPRITPAEVVPAGTLVPGDGWAEWPPADTKDFVGTDTEMGFNWQPAARWDAVPHEIADDGFEIGVVAFHTGGIQEVRFSCNNGDVVTVTEMTKNPRTGIPQYWVSLSVDEASRPLLQVKAVVVPNHGRTRTLNIELWGGSLTPDHVVYVSDSGNDSSGDGSFSAPYASISKGVRSLANLCLADGDRRHGEVRFGAGTYFWEVTGALTVTDYDGWLVCRADTQNGVEYDEVEFTTRVGNNGMQTGSLKCLYPKIQDATVTGMIYGQNSRSKALWFDRVHIKGDNTQNNLMGATWWEAYYATDCLATEVYSPFPNCTFARGNHIDWLNKDAYSGGCSCVFDCTVSNQHGFGSGETLVHTDIWQNETANGNDNVVLFGLRGRQVISDDDVTTDEVIGGPQGFQSRLTPFNVGALVDCSLWQEAYPSGSNFASPYKNLLIQNCWFYGPPSIRLSDILSAVDPETGNKTLDTFSFAEDVKITSSVFQFFVIDDPLNAYGDDLEDYDFTWDDDASGGILVDGNHVFNVWPSYMDDENHQFFDPDRSGEADPPANSPNNVPEPNPSGNTFSYTNDYSAETGVPIASGIGVRPWWSTNPGKWYVGVTYESHILDDFGDPIERTIALPSVRHTTTNPFS